MGGSCWSVCADSRPAGQGRDERAGGGWQATGLPVASWRFLHRLFDLHKIEVIRLHVLKEIYAVCMETAPGRQSRFATGRRGHDTGRLKPESPLAPLSATSDRQICECWSTRLLSAARCCWKAHIIFQWDCRQQYQGLVQGTLYRTGKQGSLVGVGGWSWMLEQCYCHEPQDVPSVTAAVCVPHQAAAKRCTSVLCVRVEALPNESWSCLALSEDYTLIAIACRLSELRFCPNLTSPCLTASTINRLQSSCHQHCSGVLVFHHWRFNSLPSPVKTTCTLWKGMEAGWRKTEAIRQCGSSSIVNSGSIRSRRFLVRRLHLSLISSQLVHSALVYTCGAILRLSGYTDVPATLVQHLSCLGSLTATQFIKASSSGILLGRC